MKKAFTLIEIMICLGIIGVISAFMLMHMRANTVKQNVLLYKNNIQSWNFPVKKQKKARKHHVQS